MDGNHHNLMNEKEAARVLHCTPAALTRWRKEGRGPSYIKVSRLVRYRAEDLAEWIASQRIAVGERGASECRRLKDGEMSLRVKQ
jgi:hypothetical protein